MFRFIASSVAVLLVAALCSATLLVDSGHSYVGPNPSAPYRNASLDTQFWNLVKTFNDPTQVGREGDLVRSGMNNSRIAARLMPAYSTLGTLSLAPTAFVLGWKIGRTIDTRFLHLSGGIGTTVSTPALISNQKWKWKSAISASYQSVGAPPSGWVWNYTTNKGTFDSAEHPCGSTPSTWCSYSSVPQDRDASYLAGWQRMTDPAYTGDLPGTTYAVVPAGAPAGRFSYQRILSAAEMAAVIRIDRSEAYSNQPFNSLTNYTIPANSGNAADREAARVAFEQLTAVSDAAQKHMNHLLAPTNPAYPNPILTEIEFPAPALAETYDSYLARLRLLGWLGVATVVQLDETGADNDYAPGGVPCTSARPYTVVTPDLPVTFYRNPTPLGSGPGENADTWDCRGGVIPPDGGNCEYDELSFPYPEWSVGRKYAETAYDQACADAWNDFLNAGGVNGQNGHAEAFTGTIKHDVVIDALTADGSSIEDWKKWEWGPYVVNDLTYVVHAYRNLITGQVRTDVGYKIKFRTEIRPDSPLQQ